MNLPKPGSRLRLILDLLNEHGPRTPQQVFELLVAAGRASTLKRLQSELSQLTSRGHLRLTSDGYKLDDYALAEDEPAEKYIGQVASPRITTIWSAPMSADYAKDLRATMERRA